jgi:hypothetical protein
MPENVKMEPIEILREIQARWDMDKERHEQSSWGGLRVDDKGDEIEIEDVPELCNTTACLAGEAAIVTGNADYKVFYHDDKNPQKITGVDLSLTGKYQDWDFIDAGAEILGLEHDHAYYLFMDADHEEGEDWVAECLSAGEIITPAGLFADEEEDEDDWEDD